MRTKKTIKAELAAAVAEPEPDLDTIEALTAELRGREGRPRLRRPRRADGGETSPEVSEDPDAEAIKSWPPALRARLGRSAYSRVIDGAPVDDPGGHGARNDTRRWSPWR